MRQAVSLLAAANPSDDDAPCRPTTFHNAVALGNVGAFKSAMLNNLIGHPVLVTTYKSIDRFLLVYRIIDGDTAEPCDPDMETVASNNNVAGQMAHPLPAFGSSSIGWIQNCDTAVGGFKKQLMKSLIEDNLLQLSESSQDHNGEDNLTARVPSWKDEVLSSNTSSDTSGKSTMTESVHGGGCPLA